MKTKHLVVIAGPTAVGKTDTSIKLAQHYNTVILSADSRQFYKELHIGTAKPSAAQLQSVKHFFIDNKSISELYGAGHFEKDAMVLLNKLFIEHDVVIVVGGSGLYIDALINGVDNFIEVPIELRETINKNFAENGIDWLREELKKRDETYFNSADINNPQRLIRALEVCIHSQLPYSSFLNKQKNQRNFTAIPILLNTKRELLYERINNRVDEMMQQGLLDEVKQLVNNKNTNALKTVGYKELFDFLEGNYTLETAIEKIKQHTRNYAKRQITWFKNKGNFEEFEPHEFEKLVAYLDIILQNG